jgi:signal transduction histidine kinase
VPERRRWRTALLFLGLSAATYIVPTGLALVLFYANLTSALDVELKEFMASFGHAIALDSGRPQFRDWTRIVQTDPARSLVSYQLFDRDGHLIEAHGQPGIERLFLKEREVHEGARSMRTCMTAMADHGGTIGYLQIQLPTKSRDEAVRELAEVTFLVAPLVLLGLGYCSFLVSERATASVRDTNNKLRSFMADASHELNTPLGIVEAALESAQKKLVGEERGKEEIEIATSALERMEKILADLMLLSTVEGGALAPAQEPISLRELVEGVALEFRPKFEQKGVFLILDPLVDGLVLGDNSALHRLLGNVVENALRYTESGGQVRLTMSKEGSQFKVVVADTGVGIAAASQQKIFERFYRVDRSRSRGSGGAGLGLPIAIAIAHSHGGNIEVQSSEGGGSRFTLVLAVAP